MSKKNKKLGRGLRDLLNQREQTRTPSMDLKPDGREILRSEEEDTKQEFDPVGQNPSDEMKSNENNTFFSSNENETQNVSNYEAFSFASVREELEKTADEVKALSEEVKNFSAVTNESSNDTENTESNKTLADYMNSTSSGNSKSIKPEILVMDSDIPINSRVEQAETTEDVNRIYEISVSLIDSNPWQPREVFQTKEISELAESIKIHGLLQPIVVRAFRDHYQLVAGERRFRAAISLNWTQVPVTIIDATDREMSELALIENLQRKDLNPIEKANSFDKYLKVNNCTQDEMAKRLCMDRSTISNYQRLLTLPSEIQQMVIDERLTQGHARSILALTKSQDQIEMAKRIADEKLSVRQTEQVISDWNKKTVSERKEETISKVPSPKSGSEKKEKSPYVLDLERQLQDILDLKVKISADSNGKGKMEIYFQSKDDFSSLMDYFKG